MTIIITKDNLEPKKIEKMDIEKEKKLQKYIHQNPEAIPIYEIQEDKKLFVAAREFPTKSGPIDALAIDQEGNIYIIETKLNKNSDRRTVVAQALDYGASLWNFSNNFSEFFYKIDIAVKNKFNINFTEKIKDFFQLSDEKMDDEKNEIEMLLESMKRNIEIGNFKFVVLMDKLDEKLKDLVIYINQNSQFDIYAVELEYYKHENYEIVIPKMFGVEMKKSIRTYSERINWDKESFLQDSKERINDELIYKLLLELYNFTEKNALLSFGTGEKSSITFKSKDFFGNSISIFTVWSYGKISFRFGNIKNHLGEKYVKFYYSNLKKILPHELLNDDMLLVARPQISLKDAFPDEKSLKMFQEITIEFINEVKKDNQKI